MASLLDEDVDSVLDSSDDPEAQLIALQRLRRQRMMQPIEANQGTSLGQTIADLGVGLGTTLSGGNGIAAVQGRISERSKQATDRLKALNDQSNLESKSLIDLARLRQQKQEALRKENELPLRMQMQLENQLSLMAATGANQQVLEKYRQSGQQAIKEMELKTRGAESEKQREFLSDQQKERIQSQKDIEAMRQRGAATRAQIPKPIKEKSIPAGEVVQQAAAKASYDQLADIEKTISLNQDKFGPVAGRLGSLNPYDKTSQVINAQLKTAAQKIGTFLEGGKLTDTDIQKYYKMLPQQTDTPEVAKDKLTLVRRLVADRATANKAALAGSGYNVGGLGEYNIPSVPSRLQPQSVSGGVASDLKQKVMLELQKRKQQKGI